MTEVDMMIGTEIVQEEQERLDGNLTDVIQPRPKHTIIIPAKDSPSHSSPYRPMTRSQARGGKSGSEPEKIRKDFSVSSLKRTIDERDEDETTDVEDESNTTTSKHPKLLSATTASMSSTVTKVDDQDVAEVTKGSQGEGSPAPGNFTFLDTSASSFTSERRGPRIRTAPPVPVPNLTKKSRGRRVPTKLTAEGGEGGEPPQKTGRVYVCKVEDCGKCFSRGEHLKRHIRSIHTHEKPFKCTHPLCDKRFNRHDNLLQHLRVHKGDDSSQTSTEADPPRARTATAPPTANPAPAGSNRSTPTQASRTRRTATNHPSRSTHESTAIPHIAGLLPPRASSSRPPQRSADIVLPRTYSYPSSPTLATPYRSPTAACFMINTNIAVSSLRTSMGDEAADESRRDAHDFSSNRAIIPKPVYNYERHEVSSEEEGVSTVHREDNKGKQIPASAWNRPSSTPSESEAVSAFAKLREGRHDVRSSGSDSLVRAEWARDRRDGSSDVERGDRGHGYYERYSPPDRREHMRPPSRGDESAAVSAFAKLRESGRSAARPEYGGDNGGASQWHPWRSERTYEGSRDDYDRVPHLRESYDEVYDRDDASRTGVTPIASRATSAPTSASTSHAGGSYHEVDSDYNDDDERYVPSPLANDEGAYSEEEDASDAVSHDPQSTSGVVERAYSLGRNIPSENWNENEPHWSYRNRSVKGSERNDDDEQMPTDKRDDTGYMVIEENQSNPGDHESEPISAFAKLRERDEHAPSAITMPITSSFRQ